MPDNSGWNEPSSVSMPPRDTWNEAEPLQRFLRDVPKYDTTSWDGREYFWSIVEDIMIVFVGEDHTFRDDNTFVFGDIEDHDPDRLMRNLDIERGADQVRVSWDPSNVGYGYQREGWWVFDPAKERDVNPAFKAFWAELHPERRWGPDHIADLIRVDRELDLEEIADQEWPVDIHLPEVTGFEYRQLMNLGRKLEGLPPKPLTPELDDEDEAHAKAGAKHLAKQAIDAFLKTN